MSARSEIETRRLLIEQGAVLFARKGVDGVTLRELHAAVGSRNRSALQYHFGSRQGLVDAIVLEHVQRTEVARSESVQRVLDGGLTNDLHELVAAMVEPLAVHFGDAVGRAGLRLVARLSPPRWAYASATRHIEAFEQAAAPSGAVVLGWMLDAMPAMPGALCRERLSMFYVQLTAVFGHRAELLDDERAGGGRSSDALWLANAVDQLHGGLIAPISTSAGRSADRR